MPALSDRLDALAFGLLAVMPLGMALINRSAQPILIAAMLAALAARASCGELAETRRRMERTLRRPLGLVCLAYLAFALVSITWGHHPRTSISMFAEVAGSAGAALVLHAALPRPVPSWAWKLAVAAMALGCVTILGELASGMAIRGSLGARNFVFIFKRSVTAMLVLFWPIAAYLWITGRRSIAGALLLLFAIAIYAAHSSGAAMGLAAGLALAGLAALSQRTASLAIAAALGLALAVAPVLGDAAERLLPERIVERLHFAHADQRLEVWQSFGEVVKRRPIGGAGFGTSTKMAQEPVAQEVPAERRVMLGAWHPHNGYLQIWAETGAVGALLAGAALMLLAFGIGRLPRPAAIATAALVASAAAVLLVGHGIWQGWWSAVIGTAAFWLARLPEPR
ncbi:O-antigen ligase family protein [Enterovirga rhinocerotis]|uniref:O-antigen ligase n=1 Tax=Enterovirga rhinocerotis TaxID=1339210 RepID=A0A4R7C5U8_9HYPH|nr:O-antigen ligase family protein [Enterovirga rhinocerotis]TDR93940.1 O-antigen ligase [Enterovirga rhinocerotis]